MKPPSHWLALVVGNSRLHWGLFVGQQWLAGWHTAHLPADQLQTLAAAHFSAQCWADLGLDLPTSLGQRGWLEGQVPLPLWAAAVVPSVLHQLASYPHLHVVDLGQVPLFGLYPTLGIDRALAVLGAGETYGWPSLVIDCGTALTFTAADQGGLVGGAIAPGLGLQLKALNVFTDQLPKVLVDPGQLPHRWAIATPDAIASGVIHTLLAGIHDFVADWQQHYPGGQVVLTGGDGAAIATYLAQQNSSLSTHLIRDDNLAFWGLRACRQQTL
ncbi:MAG: pantothenate kinase [Leptolyngbya sp. LCM1.Bin17]|nr:MAG: pantothenate kinase [Leptolyngbya sp. LCM1.Bin17]